jgi:hypothetical protein
MRWIARVLSLSSGAIVLYDLEQWAAGMVENDGRYHRGQDAEDEACK